MKTKFRIAVLSIVMVLAVSLLASCGASGQSQSTIQSQSINQSQGTTAAVSSDTTKPAEKVKIRFAHNWTGTDAKQPVFEPFLQKFQGENPDITLELEATPGMDHQTKIKTDAAANNLPDAFTYWTAAQFKPLVDAGIIADLTDLQANDADLKDRFLSGTLDALTFDNKVYGLPAESYFDAMFINKEIFDKYNLSIPKTFDDLLADTKVLKANGIIPLAEAGKGADPSAMLFAEFMGKAYGPTMSDDIKKKDFAPAIVACKHLQELVKLGSFPNGVNAMNQDEKMALYNQGKAAMLYDGSWMFGAIAPDVAAKSEVIAFPAFSDGKADPASTVGGTAMGYVANAASFKDAGKKEAIIKLFKALTGPELNSALLEKCSIPPSTKFDVDPSKLSPLMTKAIDMRTNIKEIMSFFGDEIPTDSFERYVTETQAQFEALKTPEDYAKFMSEVLK